MRVKALVGLIALVGALLPSVALGQWIGQGGVSIGFPVTVSKSSPVLSMTMTYTAVIKQSSRSLAVARDMRAVRTTVQYDTWLGIRVLNAETWKEKRDGDIVWLWYRLIPQGDLVAPQDVEWKPARMRVVDSSDEAIHKLQATMAEVVFPAGTLPEGAYSLQCEVRLRDSKSIKAFGVLSELPIIGNLTTFRFSGTKVAEFEIGLDVVGFDWQPQSESELREQLRLTSGSNPLWYVREDYKPQVPADRHETHTETKQPETIREVAVSLQVRRWDDEKKRLTGDGTTTDVLPYHGKFAYRVSFDEPNVDIRPGFGPDLPQGFIEGQMRDGKMIVPGSVRGDKDLWMVAFVETQKGCSSIKKVRLSKDDLSKDMCFYLTP